MKRILFLVFLLLGINQSNSVSGQVKNPVTSQDQQIIEKIEKAGGHVIAIAQNDNRLDVDFHLQSSDVTDQSLVSLEGLKNIYSLNLGKTKITDAGLAHIEGLASLESTLPPRN